VRHDRWLGRQAFGLRARKASKIAGALCLLVEDGFLRSVDRDGRRCPSSPTNWASITTPHGRHDRALTASPLAADEQSRSQSLIGAWKAARVSKYNHARDFEGSCRNRGQVDQTLGDASIRGGMPT
jgi:capsular polysaccharide export protein